MDVEGLIKQLLVAGREGFKFGDFTSYEAACDWRQLLQEANTALRELAAERDAAIAQQYGMADWIEQTAKERDEARAERDALRGEVERLNEQLIAERATKNAAVGWMYAEACHLGDAIRSEEFPALIDRMDAALQEQSHERRVLVPPKSTPTRA